MLELNTIVACILWLNLNRSSNVEGENCITRPSPPLNRSADFHSSFSMLKLSKQPPHVLLHATEMLNSTNFGRGRKHSVLDISIRSLDSISKWLNIETEALQWPSWINFLLNLKKSFDLPRPPFSNCKIHPIFLNYFPIRYICTYLGFFFNTLGMWETHVFSWRKRIVMKSSNWLNHTKAEGTLPSEISGLFRF